MKLKLQETIKQQQKTLYSITRGNSVSKKRKGCNYCPFFYIVVVILNIKLPFGIGFGQVSNFGGSAAC